MLSMSNDKRSSRKTNDSTSLKTVPINRSSIQQYQKSRSNNKLNGHNDNESLSDKRSEKSSDEESVAQYQSKKKKSRVADTRMSNKLTNSNSNEKMYENETTSPISNPNQNDKQDQLYKQNKKSNSSKVNSASRSRASAGNSRETFQSRSSPSSERSNVDMQYVYTPDIGTRILILENKLNCYEDRINKLETALSERNQFGHQTYQRKQIQRTHHHRVVPPDHAFVTQQAQAIQ